MTFKELPAGQYSAQLVDYGLQEVEKLQTYKASFQFDIKVNTDFVRGYFEQLLFKKDGTPNQKLLKTLVTMDFTGDSFEDLTKADVLNTTKEYLVTVIKDGEYTKIDWVNLPGSGAMRKVTEVKKMKGMNIKSALMSTRAEMGVIKKPMKNYADDIKVPEFNTDEELPF